MYRVSLCLVQNRNGGSDGQPYVPGRDHGDGTSQVVRQEEGAVAFTWLCVALGLASKSVETASNTPMPLMLLPFLGSGFVPTDSMPAPVRWFADHQPFTPMMETLRGLLLGTAIGNNAIEAVAWCAGITLVCFMWARSLYNRDPVG